MIFSKVWDMFVDFMIQIGMPIVCFFHFLHMSFFFNAAIDDAEGLEKLSNYALVPFHYVFVGKKISKSEDGVTYKVEQRFDYKEHFWLKTYISMVYLPQSFILGSSLKAISHIFPKNKARYKEVLSYFNKVRIQSNNDYYCDVGIDVQGEKVELNTTMHTRRAGDEAHLAEEKKALLEIVEILNKYQIPFWVDCGTCLGAYRYGGVIPWDFDIDIAVLLPDFANVKSALKELDSSKYSVWDWSSRDKPNTFMKIYVKDTKKMIDIYHFAIDAEKRQISYVLSNRENVFLPEWWKIRESRFTIATSFDEVFPLKRAFFDGVEVFVPNQTKKYLQSRYGENIEPAKVYNELTGEYEKDLTHPYWNREYAH